MRVKVEVFGHEQYAFEHGHRPRGRGGWWFSPENPYARNWDVQTATVGAFHGTFREAVKQAKAWAAEHGYEEVWVCP
jgi:hypothetical protein